MCQRSYEVRPMMCSQESRSTEGLLDNIEKDEVGCRDPSTPLGSTVLGLLSYGKLELRVHPGL
jgi:hypothetical protein